MTTKSAWLGLLLLLFLSSCVVPRYLPPYEKIDVNTRGSHIRVTFNNGSILSGELIAIDNKSMVVLSEKTWQCESHSISDIRRFKLRYAQPKFYGWTIPAFTAFTMSHGFFALLTAPLNLAVTTVISLAGENAFTYNEKTSTFDMLRMFARFPDGIPPHIELDEIR